MEALLSSPGRRHRHADDVAGRFRGGNGGHFQLEAAALRQADPISATSNGVVW